MIRYHPSGMNGETFCVYNADDMRVMLYDSAADEERWRLRGLGQEVLRESVRTSAGWAWSRDYVFRDGEVLASISSGEGTRHQHPNHLGTPRVITGESGLVMASQLLRPFGEEASGSGAGTGFLKFTGHERDFNGSSAVNHLDYMRARFYSPHLGRFLSPDRVLGSVELPQSWNRYAYVRNNPLKFVDPDGQVPIVPIAIGLAITGALFGPSAANAPESPDTEQFESADLPLDVMVTEAAAGPIFGKLFSAVRGLSGKIARRLSTKSDSVVPQNANLDQMPRSLGAASRPEMMARRLGLNFNSPTTRQLVSNLDTDVATFVGKFRKGSIKSRIPTEFLEPGVTVEQALKEGGSRMRKLLTDNRFVK